MTFTIEEPGRLLPGPLDWRGVPCRARREGGRLDVDVWTCLHESQSAVASCDEFVAPSVVRIVVLHDPRRLRLGDTTEVRMLRLIFKLWLVRRFWRLLRGR